MRILFSFIGLLFLPVIWLGIVIVFGYESPKKIIIEWLDYYKSGEAWGPFG